MCGIIGITSTKQVSSTIINSLKKLEYRGYDSAGIATLNDGFINEVKCEGRVESLEKNVSNSNLDILDFSPHRSLYDYWSNKNVNYTANDFENEFLSHTQQDITSLVFKNDAFDLIICYHVLEHIQDDSKAISELYRVLKPNALLLAQVPFTMGKTDEDPSITSPEMRRKRFGQEDHVRYYGKNDFVNKLNQAGFNVNALNFVKNINNELIYFYGLNSDDTIFICKKES